MPRVGRVSARNQIAANGGGSRQSRSTSKTASDARAVAIASPVMLRGFELLEDSLRDFAAYLARKNLRAADLIGRAADQHKSFAEMPLRTDNWRNYVPKV